MLRYLIENHGPNKESEMLMLQGAFSICKSVSLTRITLVVPNKAAFLSSSVCELLGKEAKKLYQGKILNLSANLTLDLVYASNPKSIYCHELIVAMYLSLDELYKFDADMSAKAILFLPWMENEGKQWLAIRNPTILGTNTWRVQHVSLPSEVNNVLSIMADGINLSTGLAHPSDRKTAHEALMKIRDLGYSLDSNDVKNWAIQNGWGLDAANDLAKEVAKVFKCAQS